MGEVVWVGSVELGGLVWWVGWVDWFVCVGRARLVGLGGIGLTGWVRLVGLGGLVCWVCLVGGVGLGCLVG